MPPFIMREEKKALLLFLVVIFIALFIVWVLNSY